MHYRGVVQNRVIVLEGPSDIPDGALVTVIPDEGMKSSRQIWHQFNANADRLFERLSRETGQTTDSVDLLRELREEQTNQ